MGAGNLLGLIEELLQKLIQILIALDLAYSVPNHNEAPQTTPCHLKMTKSKKNQYTKKQSGCLSAQFPKIDPFSKTCHDSPVRPTTKVDIDSESSTQKLLWVLYDHQ